MQVVIFHMVIISYLTVTVYFPITLLFPVCRVISKQYSDRKQFVKIYQPKDETSKTYHLIYLLYLSC